MFEPSLALSSLSGESDAAWATAGAEFAGAAFLGGIALDERSRASARLLVARDRNEFLPDDPFEFIDQELTALEDVPVQAGFNVRSATVDPVGRAAAICANRDAILEVNAHCRQPELTAIGCGESLLQETERLCAYVEAAGDATVSVKVRAEVPEVNLGETARAIENAGAAIIHVDAMDSPDVVASVASASDLFVVANNGVRDKSTALAYLERGADAVSVGRPSDDPVVLARVRDAVASWSSDESGDGTGRRTHK